MEALCPRDLSAGQHPPGGMSLLQSLTCGQTEHRKKHIMVGCFLLCPGALWGTGDALKVLCLWEQPFTWLHC